MSVKSAGRRLEETILSILDQSYDSFEFIIVNDGDDPEIRTLTDSINDPRLIVLNQPWQGLTKSLNDALQISRGKFIARMDADDFSYPTRFERQIAYLDSHPEVGLLGTALKEESTEGKFISEVVFTTGNTELKDRLQFQNQFCHGTVMFRKECLSGVGPYRNEFLKAQDYDLWLRIADKFDIANLPEVLYKRRVEKNSISIASRDIQDQYAQIARDCAQARRRGKPEPLHETQNISASNGKDGWISKRRSRARYNFHLGRQSLKDRQTANARLLFLKGIIAWPLFIHQWFFLFATLFPIRVIDQIEPLWKKIQRRLGIHL